jgi:hypothetical protein
MEVLVNSFLCAMAQFARMSLLYVKSSKVWYPQQITETFQAISSVTIKVMTCLDAAIVKRN